MIRLGKKTQLFNAGVESYKRYANRKEETSPEISIVFSPFEPPLTPLELTGQVCDKLLVSLNCMKSRSQPGGFFTFTLVDDPRAIRTFNLIPWKRALSSLVEVFRPAAQTQLWIDGLHVMTGYVVKAERSASVGNAPLLTVEVAELGNLYAESILSKQLQIWGLDTTVLGDVLQQIETALGAVSGLPLPEAVSALCQAFWNSTLLYRRGAPKPYFRFSDGIPAATRMLTLPPPLGCVSTANILRTLFANSAMFSTNAGASFWDYLKHLVPEPFCELYTESGGRTICTGRLTAGGDASFRTNVSSAGASSVSVPGTTINITPMLPGFNYLVLRTTPYDNPLLGWTPFKQTFQWGLGVPDLLLAGDFVIIDDRDVIAKTLGRSMLKQYNVFYTRLTAGAGKEAMSHSRPAVAPGPLLPFGYGGIKTFPVRTLDVTVDAVNTQGIFNYAAQKIEKQQKLTQEIILNNQLLVWFRNNHRFLEGSITAGRLLPHARPGMLLLYLKPHASSGKNAECAGELGTYYIDNVSHDFQAGQAPSTSLTLIRGTPAPFAIPELMTMMAEWETLPNTPEFWDYPNS